MSACPFCGIAASRAAAPIFAEDGETLAFADLTPQAPLHALGIPKRHIEHFGSLKARDGELLGRLAQTAQRVAEQAGLGTRGDRVVCKIGPDAGNSVAHLHLACSVAGNSPGQRALRRAPTSLVAGSVTTSP